MTNTASTFTQSRWSLQDLFPQASGPELETVFTQLQEEAAAFEKVRPELRPDLPVETFLEYIRLLEKINDQAYRLSSYAVLWFSEDTQNQAAQVLMARMEQFGSELSNRLLFFGLWWKDLPEEDAQRLMAASGDYRYWLEEMRHFKPYTLSEPEEKVINIKSVTGASALNMLYDSITNRYTFKLTVDGQERELTRGELMIYVRHHDPQLRAAAYQELYRVFGNDSPILGQIYQTLIRDWRNEQVGLRGFANPIAARNLGQRHPDDVVQTLLQVANRTWTVSSGFSASRRAG